MSSAYVLIELFFVLFFCIKLYELFVYFWKLIPCRSHCLQILFPILWVVFLFMVCLFMVSFAVQQLVSLIRSHLFIFISIALGD